jgi:formyl-CoA transferase
MGGLRYVTGEPDRPPARAGISIGDSLAGLHAALGVMMALHGRHRTGRGQVVDAAIYESVLSVMENLITEYGLTGYIRERSGAVLPGIAPSNAYPTGDGALVVIGANQDTLFARLCEAMDRPDLAADPRFSGHAARGVHQALLDSEIAAWTSTLKAADLLARMEAHGVAAGRVYRAPDMLDDPQFVARQSIIETPHPVFGAVRMQNVFPRLSESPGQVRWPGPALGEHTDLVLAHRLGLSDQILSDLRSRAII